MQALAAFGKRVKPLTTQVFEQPVQAGRYRRKICILQTARTKLELL